MRRPSICALALVAVASAGCGEDSAPPTPDPALAEIRQVVALSNSTFANGRFGRTCRTYTLSVRRELRDLAGAESCPAAQAALARQVRATFSESRFKALTAFGIESVEDVTGDSAIARYGELPDELEGIAGLKSRMSLRMKRTGGRWLVDSLPY